jgi:tetratricopeptide (TPR) repeat protein
MKKLSLIILLATSLLNSCNSQNNIDRLGQEGVALFENGDIKGALAKFEEIIKIDNKNEEAYLRKADCLDLLGDIQGSISSYSKSIEINPKNKIAFYNRALSYEKLNDFKNAIFDYNSALSTDPNNNSELNSKLIYQNLGILYGQQYQLDKAIEAFTNAIKIDDQYADAYHNRGYAYQLMNNHENAILDFDKAIQLDPSSRDYRDSKNRSLEMLKN